MKNGFLKKIELGPLLGSFQLKIIMRYILTHDNCISGIYLFSNELDHSAIKLSPLPTYLPTNLLLWTYGHLRIVYGAFLVALKLFSLSIMAQKPPPSC